MPTKRTKMVTPDPDDDDDTNVEDDPKVQKARQRLRDVNSKLDAAEAQADGDDEDDDTPSALPRTIKGGWSEGKREQEASVPWAQTFRPDKTSQLIKFLDDEPYASFRRHWIESTSREGGKTNRPYTCLQSVKKECPLCKAGDRPSAVSSFNIVLLDNKGELTLKSWDAGARLFQVLQGYATDPKIGPLPRHFFLVSKSGEKATTQYNVSSVRSSALEEDYDIPVPTASDLEEIAKTKYKSDIVPIPSVKQMRELADEISDEYDD